MHIPKPNLLLPLALCAGMTLGMTPKANAGIIDELRYVQSVVENLIRGVVNDVERVTDTIGQGADVVKNLIGDKPKTLIERINEQRVDYEKEYRRQLEKASEATGANPADLQRSFERQVKSAERTFRRQQRKGARRIDRSDRTVSRSADRADFDLPREYDPEELERRMQARMREYEREIERLRKRQERALREYKRRNNRR